MSHGDDGIFAVPDYMVSRRRLIISTDAKNEADDQYAIVHALMSPILDVRGIVPAHFGERGGADGMQRSRDEVDLLLRLMDLTGQVTVANGSPAPMRDEWTPQDSPGAQLILDEARSNDSGSRSTGPSSTWPTISPPLAQCSARTSSSGRCRCRRTRR